jgi:hypothetical protein
MVYTYLSKQEKESSWQNGPPGVKRKKGKMETERKKRSKNPPKKCKVGARGRHAEGFSYHPSLLLEALRVVFRIMLVEQEKHQIRAEPLSPPGTLRGSSSLSWEATCAHTMGESRFDHRFCTGPKKYTDPRRVMKHCSGCRLPHNAAPTLH